MRLSSDLLTKFSKATLKIYTSTAPSDIPNLYIGAIRELIDCEHLCYNEFGVKHFCGIVDPIIDADLNNRFNSLSDQHPSIKHIRETGLVEAVKISDFVCMRNWQCSNLYNEFFRKLGIQHQLALMFPVETIQIGFAANREGRDFSENDRTLLSLIQPHLRQAYQNAKALERSQHASDAQVGGTLIVSTNGNLLFASSNARTVVRTFFGAITRDCLPDELRRWIMNGLRNKTVEGMCDGAFHPLNKKGEKSSVTVRLSPNYVTGEHVIVIEEQMHQASLSVFTQFGLSKRESEVLSWVAQGKTNPEIAVILNISARTVDHHVAHILAKIGVEGRGGATFWALEMLRVQQARSILSRSGS